MEEMMEQIMGSKVRKVDEGKIVDEINKCDVSTDSEGNKIASTNNSTTKSDTNSPTVSPTNSSTNITTNSNLEDKSISDAKCNESNINNSQRVVRKKNDSTKSCSLCSDPDTKFMILCNECNEWQHFLCTKLPCYQIHVFMTTTRKFKCSRCVDIPKDMTKACFDFKYDELEQKHTQLKIQYDDLVVKNGCIEEEVNYLRDEITKKSNNFKAQIIQMANSNSDNEVANQDSIVQIANLQKQLTAEKKKSAQKILELNSLKNSKAKTNCECGKTVDFDIYSAFNSNTSSVTEQLQTANKILISSEKKLTTELKQAKDELKRMKEQLELRSSISSHSQVDKEVWKKLLDAKDQVIKIQNSHIESLITQNSQIRMQSLTFDDNRRNNQQSHKHQQNSYDQLQNSRKYLNTCYKYQKGNCHDNNCKFYHPTIACKYYTTQKSCRYGVKCRYSHRNNNDSQNFSQKNLSGSSTNHADNLYNPNNSTNINNASNSFLRQNYIQHAAPPNQQFFTTNQYSQIHPKIPTQQMFQYPQKF